MPGPDIRTYEGDARPPTPDISIVVTTHHEGTLAHHTLRSLKASCARAREAGLTVEVVIVLDRPDEATRAYVAQAPSLFGTVAQVRLLGVDHGDLGLSRNSGLQAARGELAGILDADNLVSSNWIQAGVATARQNRGAVVHPEHVVTFEARRTIWHMLSSKDERFRGELFYEYNYWDAFSIAERSLFLAHPYAATGTHNGFGPEDWHWNLETLGAGVPHVLAPQTALFYRVKSVGSLLSAHEAVGSLLPRTQFLTSQEIAAAAIERRKGLADDADEPVRARLRDLRSEPLRRTLRAYRRARAGKPADPPLIDLAPSSLDLLPGRQRLGWRGNRVDKRFDPVHYRLLNPDLGDVADEDLFQHYQRQGQREGRRAWLHADELRALDPRLFDPNHYRVLHADLAHLDAEAAARHYLEHGRQEGRRTLLTAGELDRLDTFDHDLYRRHSPDLASASDEELVAHFLRYGLAERRIGASTPRQRALTPPELPAWLLEEWTTQHAFDTRIPVPDAATVRTYRHLGHAPDAMEFDAAAVWWHVMRELPESPDILFLAPWMRLGGADRVLAAYVETVRRLRPQARIAVVTTMGRSSHRHWLPEDIAFVELADIPGFSHLPWTRQVKLVGDLLVQLAPEVVHIVNSGQAFDAVQAYPRAIRHASRVFESTFVVERGRGGQLTSWLAGRPSDYLQPVSAVLVDSAWLGDFFWEMARMDRNKFVVHHHPVDIPAKSSREAAETRPEVLKVLWAARFDHQKRLDVLADVVDAAAERGLPVEFHVHGVAVMDDDPEITASLDRLRKAGVQVKPPFRDNLASLPLHEFGLFLMTSEWEGVPLTLLDAMANGLPVLVPPVGGIAETVDDSVGFVTSHFAAVDDYVDVLQRVAHDPSPARERAARARARLLETYSWDHFRAEVAATPGYLPRAPDSLR